MSRDATYAGIQPKIRQLTGEAREPSITIKKLRMALMAIYIMPLLVIAYLFTQYIYPMFDANGEDVAGLGISAVITFAVILSVLGLALISKSANESVESLNSLNKRMDSLLTLTRHFEETSYVDTLVDSVAKSARDVLDAEAGSLMLYGSDGNLRFEYVEGPAADILKGKTIRPGEGIAGWTALNKTPIIVNDVRRDKRFAGQFDVESGFVTSSVICVPLTFSGHDIGVLEVINKKDRTGFTEADKMTLMSIAEHAAASIYRNKSYEDIKSDFVHVMDFLILAMDGPMPEKRGHSRRVARYAVKLAKRLGLSEDDVREVYFGALMHDIGLLKYDMTNAVDKEKFKLHSAVGSDMVRNINQWRKVSRMIRDHHERYDGTGYPSGLSGEQISIGGRIIGLAEAFDVMTSSKSYKPAVSFEEAAEEIRALAGYQFDPVVANVFLESFTKDDIED